MVRITASAMALISARGTRRGMAEPATMAQPMPIAMGEARPLPDQLQSIVIN
ncbi:MAG: hypothetical protein WBA29_13560 [Xanthobacteraceae bacterium]